MNLFKGKKILSMYLSSSRIEVIEGKNIGTIPKIYRHFHIDLLDNIYEDGRILDMEQIVYILKKGMKENNISMGNVVGVINSSRIITREIRLPKLKLREIESILRYNITEYIPVDPDDYIIQFLVLDSVLEEGIEKNNILIMAVPKVIIESHLEMFRGSGLTPQKLDIHGHAIAKLIGKSNIINSKHSCDNKTILSLELSHMGIELTLIDKGLVRITRFINKGMYYILHGDKNLAQIEHSDLLDCKIIKKNLLNVLEDITIIIKYYININPDNKIDMILLLGEFINIDDVEEILSNFFGIEALILKSIDSLNFGGELYRYANSIGGIIQNKGGRI